MHSQWCCATLVIIETNAWQTVLADTLMNNEI